MLGIVCPGQGSQKPGMLNRWLQLSGAAELLAQFSEAAGLNLAELGTGADANAIQQTAVAQPLIVATSLLSYQFSADWPQLLHGPVIVAGHSVGMLTAFAIAGVYDAAAAVRLAAIRGRIFAKVTEQTDTCMAALIGRNVRDKFATETWGQASSLNLAVVNSDSQVVVGGETAKLVALANSLPTGIRLVPLAVSGAFHTTAMQSAVEPFKAVLQKTEIQDPKLPVINDLTGELFKGGKFGYGTANDIVQHLTAQITNPVRWDKVQQQLANCLTETDQITELAPAGTLTPLLKRSLPKILLTPLA